MNYFNIKRPSQSRYPPGDEAGVMRKGPSLRWRAMALLVTGLLVGVMFAGTPATAHVGGTVAHLANHMKTFFYTKKQSNDLYAKRKVEPWHKVGAVGQPAFNVGAVCLPGPSFRTWTNYDEATYNGAGFYKDRWGVVHLRGLVANGCVGGTIFTLPPGYRPDKLEVIATIACDGCGPAGVGRVSIRPNGNVVAWDGGNTWFALDGVTFKAA